MRRSASALGCLLLAVALALAIALRWTPPERVADLRPRPDALGYEAVARSVAAGDGFVLDVAGRPFPPMHPPGFATLLALAFAVRDGGPGSGIHVVAACAAATVAVSFAIASGAAGPLAGGVAALLVATSPLHVRWSRAVMSDVPAAAAVALCAWMALAALRVRAPAWCWLAVGAAVGLATTIRTPCGLLVLAIGATLLLEREPVRARLRALAALGAGFAAGIVPLLVFHHRAYGAPWRDAPSVWTGGGAFGGPITLAERSAGIEPNLVFYPKLVAGLGDLYAWPAGVLLALGVVLGLRGDERARRLVVLAGTYTAILLALHLPLAWQWGRYLLLALPLLVAVAALPIGCTRGRVWLAATAALALLAIVLPLRTPAAYAPPDPPTHEVATLRALDAVLEPDAAVLLASSPALFDLVLRRSRDRVLVPLGLDEVQTAVLVRGVAPLRPAPRARWVRPVLHAAHDPRVLERRLRAVLAEGRPVYFAGPADDATHPASRVRSKLEDAFTFEPLALASPWQVFRVRLAGGGRTPDGPSGEDGDARDRTRGRARSVLLATARRPIAWLRTRDARPARRARPRSAVVERRATRSLVNAG